MASAQRLDVRWAALLMLFVGCASTPKPVAPPKPPAPAPLARSSIDAVLLSRGELELTEPQVKQLQDRDAQREKDDADIVRALAARRPQKSSGAPQNSSASGSSNASGGDPSNVGVTPPGGGRGMGGGRHRGGGTRGGTASPGETREQLEQRLDDDDTAAYLDAEAVLTEAQKPRAREIASDYREQLWNYQQSQHALAGEPAR